MFGTPLKPHQSDSRIVCLAKWCFGGLGRRSQRNTPVQEQYNYLALPPKAAGPKNHSCLENVRFVGVGTPGLPKNTWPTNHFGIPSASGSSHASIEGKEQPLKKA